MAGPRIAEYSVHENYDFNRAHVQAAPAKAILVSTVNMENSLQAQLNIFTSFFAFLAAAIGLSRIETFIHPRPRGFNDYYSGGENPNEKELFQASNCRDLSPILC